MSKKTSIQKRTPGSLHRDGSAATSKIKAVNEKVKAFMENKMLVGIARVIEETKLMCEVVDAINEANRVLDPLNAEVSRPAPKI